MGTTPLTGLHVLVLDDEPLLRRQLQAALERLGAEVTTADTVGGARRLAADMGFDVALLDVNLPDGLGTDLLRDRVFGSATGVVIMTAEGGVSGAVEAMRLGALDYLTKPFDPGVLSLTLQRVRRGQAAERVEEHRKAGAPESEFFFGESLAPLRARLDRILAADLRMQTQLAPVLIQGETGTGKTTIARWIHRNGPRGAAPIVEMNCSALPESLAESELFGHEKGAFTDARSARMGLFEAAQGGTLFLDELASLALPLQAKLLSVLENHRIRRVGASREIPVDVRIIAAANQDLRRLVAEGRFREDLLHRLDLFRVDLPPLRERGDDVLRLAEALMDRLVRRHRVPRRPLSPAGRRRLRAYPWPGNVRELTHELERALVFEEGDALDFESLMGVGAAGDEAPAAAVPAGTGESGADDWFRPGYRFPESGFQLEQAIRRIIDHALVQTHGNVSKAARLLGVSRDYLRYRLQGGSGGE